MKQLPQHLAAPPNRTSGNIGLAYVIHLGRRALVATSRRRPGAVGSIRVHGAPRVHRIHLKVRYVVLYIPHHMPSRIRVRTRGRSSALVRSGRRKLVLYRTPRTPLRSSGFKRLPLTGFPNRKLIRLRYSTVVNINPPASGNVTAHYFHANGMYDPDHTGIGHQPLGYDQWAAIYDHYTVLGAKIHVQQTPNGTADTQSAFLPGVFGVFIDDDNVISYTKVSEVIESKQNGAMSSYRSYGYPQTLTGGMNPSIVKKFSTKKFFGIRNPVGKSDYRGSFIGSNPNEGAYFVLWAGAPDGAQDVPSMTFMVTIEYIAMCTEPKFIAQS